MDNQYDIPQPTNEIATPPTKNRSLLVTVLVGLLLLGIGLVGGYYFATTGQMTKVTPTPTPSVAVLSPTMVKTVTPTKTDINPDWKTFTSKKYNYSIQYPPDATITLASKDDFSYETDKDGNPVLEELKNVPANDRMSYLYDKFGGEICVNISYKLGHISISAKENNGARYVICSPTGVGVYAKKITDTMKIGAVTYTFNGMQQDDPGYDNLKYDSEFESADINGTVITLGSVSGNDATLKEYLGQKEELKQIISTFKESQ